MGIMAMLAAIKRTPKQVEDRKEHPDPTPLEVTPMFARPISSLEDLRNMMTQISNEAASAGLESFEEFYDFGEDTDFEDIPAPAQLKHEAILLARDRDFEGEVLKAKEDYRLKLNEEARALLLKEFKADKALKAKKEEKEEEE